MGNQASTLPFEVGEAIEPYSGNHHWTLHRGSRKDDNKDDKDKVTIFRFLKSQADKLAAAQRNWQKLRTLRHPFVLSFVDGIELDDSIMVVTEDIIPLEVWINEQTDLLSSSKTPDDIERATQEIIWGFKCILDALSFLHNNCNVIHGYLGIHAIFISKNGDWKLGAMDLACNISDDEDFFKANEHLLGKPFRSPERVGDKWLTAFQKGSSSSVSAGAMDIYALAQVIQHCFQSLSISTPDSLEAHLKNMTKVTPKARTTSSQLCQSAIFASEYIQLMTSLGELSLKPPNECVEILGKLAQRAGGIPRAVCTHKILPNVGRALQTASQDFQNRDLRESARQTVQSSLTLLSQLADSNKIEEIHFQSRIVQPICILWSISDRAVRTALLKTLKSFIPLMSSDTINKKIFEPLLAGFADSNYKMREESLKSLIPLVDKLQEKQLQDQLVRCVCNLQADPEAAIRTNATIFIGKIASKLHNNVKAKVLCSAFTKAMKDGFVPCRVAGLKAALACLSNGHFEPNQIATKLMPQVCLLLVDVAAEIRELADRCLKECLAAMLKHHKVLLDSAEREKEKEKLKDKALERDKAGGDKDMSSHISPDIQIHHGSSSTHSTANSTSSSAVSHPPTGAGNAGVFGAWSSLSFSWAVDGLAKSLVNTDTNHSNSANPTHDTETNAENYKSSASSTVTSGKNEGGGTGKSKNVMTSSAVTATTSDDPGDGWGDFNVDDDDIPIKVVEKEEKKKKVERTRPPRATKPRTTSASAVDNDVTDENNSQPLTSAKTLPLSSSTSGGGGGGGTITMGKNARGTAGSTVSSTVSSSSASKTMSTVSTSTSKKLSQSQPQPQTQASEEFKRKPVDKNWDLDLDLEKEINSIDLDLEAEIAAMDLSGLDTNTDGWGDLELDDDFSVTPSSVTNKKTTTATKSTSITSKSNDSTRGATSTSKDLSSKSATSMMSSSSVEKPKKTAVPVRSSFEDEDDISTTTATASKQSPKPTSIVKKSASSSTSTTSTSASTGATSGKSAGGGGGGTAKPKKAVAVTKMAVESGENWDDF